MLIAECSVKRQFSRLLAPAVVYQTYTDSAIPDRHQGLRGFADAQLKSGEAESNSA